MVLNFNTIPKQLFAKKKVNMMYVAYTYLWNGTILWGHQSIRLLSHHNHSTRCHSSIHASCHNPPCFQAFLLQQLKCYAMFLITFFGQEPPANCGHPNGGTTKPKKLWKVCKINNDKTNNYIHHVGFAFYPILPFCCKTHANSWHTRVP